MNEGSDKQPPFDEDDEFEPGERGPEDQGPDGQNQDDESADEDFLDSSLSLDSDAPPPWGAPLQTLDRYEAFEAAVRHWFKSRGVSVIISEGVLRAVADGESLSQFGLSNIVSVCAAAPIEQWPEIIDRHFEALRQMHARHKDLKSSVGGWEQIRPRLVPRLWEPAALGDATSHLICREDIPGLVTTLAVNLDDSVRGISRKEADEWDRSDELLFETAIDNVEALTPVEITPIDAGNPEGVQTIFAESVFVAARALRFERFTTLHGEFGAFVSMPVRHAMLAVPLREIGAILPLLGMIIPLTKQLEEEGPGPVSARVYWWRLGQWSEVRYSLQGDRLEIAPPPELVELLESHGDEDADSNDRD